METLEIILYSVLLFGVGSIITILFVESIVNRLSDNNILKKWWRRNVIDNDPYEK